MRQAVRAIIIRDNHLLVMHRNKFGTEYDTLPGGNIEMGESAEQALYREVHEETMIHFESPKLVLVEESGHPYGTQFVYLCHYVSGEPVLHPESEEAKINVLGKNLYEPRWVELSKLPDMPFVSERLKRAVVHGAKHGFPEQPTRVTH